MILPILKTDRCILRLPSKEDVPEIVKFYLENKEHLAPWDPFMPDDFFTKVYWQKKVKEAQEEFQNHQTVRLHIFLSDSNKLIGMINFTRMVRGVFHCCGLGYKIGHTHEGKGLMKESLQGAIEYIFDELNFHRIEANYIPSNLRSEKLLRKLGFEKEGYAKNYLKISGKWQDHILNSLTNKNWSEK
ncbi:MAG: 30S ribosomal protein S5 alanine N-acetyltransferase [Bdellovibrionaceae bacterium]|nr:30S ribosomal protein S5 alanine N-acetyltransferase [Pseudobdellovibrionaceae bacterium]|tara:strand:+ start:333 stop:893 length:561 start_codon:yes stop_codon:yes gene_type:complete